MRFIERVRVEQMLHVRRDEAVDVQAGHRAESADHAPFDLARDPEADGQHPDQQDREARDQEPARKTQSLEGKHCGTAGAHGISDRSGAPWTKV